MDNNSNSHSNLRENEIRGFTRNGQNTAEIDSGSELNRVSGELNTGKEGDDEVFVCKTEGYK